jgi:ferritin-like metal-binding protein YciE
VKNALSDFGAEQFEVACYRALTAAVTELAEANVARLCSENMKEDGEMARWLDQQLPAVVRQALTKKTTGVSP